MNTKDKNMSMQSKDIDNLIMHLLKDYINDEVIIAHLIKSIYNDNFIHEIKKHIVDVTQRNELLKRLSSIYNTLDCILSNVDQIKSNNQTLLNILAKNKWDTEVGHNGYDFVHKEYMIKSNLRQILAQKNMTQSDLSKKTGISPATISNIIKHPSKANLFNILKIAYTLNVTIKEIFYLAEQKND